MKRRVADIIMDILVEKGITDCFGVVGGGAMHLDNALALNNKIHKYFNHHEQASAMAAEAYARISGKMAAVCVTSGPGATNTITGVMGCWQDSLPMLVLSGQVRYEISVEKSELPLRYRGIQEFEIIPSVKNMTKYAVMITDPLTIRRELCKAIDIAMNGRRGPVWLDIPLDIQSAQVEEEDLYPEEKSQKQLVVSDEELEMMFEKIKNAERPCILAGNGIANSHNIEEFREFAERTGIPVIAACIAADAMYMDYDNYYGLSGSIGPRTGNFIVQNADVILALGCSMGFKMTGFEQKKFAPHAYIIAVDIDRNEMIKPGVRIDMFIHSDLTAFFNKANETVCRVEVKSEWDNYCKHLKKRFSVFEPAAGLSDDERVCSYKFWEEYEKYEPEDSITVLGNNTANSAKLQIGIKRAGQRIVANNNCGSMGADLPEAVGAAVASKKTVICATGDGSIMMNIQELQTIRQYNLPVKVIVFSNDGYNAIRQTSKNFFNGVCIGCTAETGVSFPEFSDVAKTFGMSYMRCNNNGELQECLKEFFSKKENVLLEISQRLDDPVSPKVMSRMKEDGSFDTPSLEDMAPFISQEEHDKLMLW
mgnify:CR=1 FL=1